jgi:hypothetical protein
MGRTKQQQSSSSKPDAQPDCVSTKDWLYEQVRQQLNLEALGCGKAAPIVSLSTGQPRSPLPLVLAKVRASGGWLPKIVADPVRSKKASLEDIYRHEQDVFVCLPHVSAVSGCVGAGDSLVVVLQYLTLLEPKPSTAA